MNRYGTVYGGWNLPKNIELSSDSIVYSAGVGEDISFDILLQEKFDLNIVLIDPTQRALWHFEEVKDFFSTKNPDFSGDIQRDYLKIIGNSRPNFSKFTYIQKGLWSHADSLKFYKPTNEKYVSHTLIENMYSNKYEVVEVDSVKNIMNALNHTHIDILKVDIEGSELIVLGQMLKDGIFPRFICIEFDLKLKGVDRENKTESLINDLHKAGYILADNDTWNCLFILQR